MTNNGEEQGGQVVSTANVPVNGEGTKITQQPHKELEISPSDEKQDPALVSQENEDMSNAKSENTPTKDDSTPNVTPTKETSDTMAKQVKKEVLMSTTEAQQQNKALPRGYAYVPLDNVQKPLFDTPPILTEKRKRKPKTSEDVILQTQSTKKKPTSSNSSAAPTKKAKNSKPAPKPQKIEREKRQVVKKKSLSTKQEQEDNSYKKTFNNKRSSRRSEIRDDEGDAYAAPERVATIHKHHAQQVARERSAQLKAYEDELRRREEEIRRREEEAIKKEQELRRLEEEKRRQDILRRKEQELWQKEELISRKEFELKQRELELLKLRERDELLQTQLEEKRRLEAELRKQREETVAASNSVMEYNVDNDEELEHNKKQRRVTAAKKRKSYDSYDEYATPSKKQTRVKVEKAGQLTPEFQECHKLLIQLMKHKYGPPFLQPVDPVLLGIPDYFTVIKQPMDLGTVQQKLEDNSYSTAEEFAADVRLVWSNATTYNRVGTEVYYMATVLSELFEKKWESLLMKMNKDASTVKSQLEAHIQQLKNSMKQVDQELEMLQSKGSPPATPQTAEKSVASSTTSAAPKVKVEMTFDEKVKLSQDIGNLQVEDLSGVVQIIQQSMPQLAQSTDEIEINVDTLDNATLRKLEKYVAKCLKRRNKKSNNKTKAASGSESDGSDSSDSDEDDEEEGSEQPQQSSTASTTSTTTTAAVASSETKVTDTTAAASSSSTSTTTATTPAEPTAPADTSTTATSAATESIDTTGTTAAASSSSTSTTDTTAAAVTETPSTQSAAPIGTSESESTAATTELTTAEPTTQSVPSAATTTESTQPQETSVPSEETSAAPSAPIEETSAAPSAPSEETNAATSAPSEEKSAEQSIEQSTSVVVTEEAESKPAELSSAGSTPPSSNEDAAVGNGSETTMPPLIDTEPMDAEPTTTAQQQ